VGRKILITGATGTVAAATAKHLSQTQHEVIGVSRSIEPKHYYDQVEQIDLLDQKDLEKLRDILKSVDAVFHLAWNIPVENFDTGESWEGNLEMYQNILEASKEAGVPIFINGSSIHAGTGGIPAYTVEASLEDTPEPYRSSIDPENDYDLRKRNPEKLLSPLDENPDSPYGHSKIETERTLKEAVSKGDFELGVSIRIGGVNPEDKKELEDEPYYSSLRWDHKDLGRTIQNILEADLSEKKDYHQFYGVSDNEGRIFSIENSFIGDSNTL